MEGYKPSQIVKYSIEVDINSVEKVNKDIMMNQSSLLKPHFDPKLYARENQ